MARFGKLKGDSEDLSLIVGRVVRAIAGFYYVKPLSASENDCDNPIECAIRGRLKLGSEGILVGDKVEFSLIASDETKESPRGIITAVLPRETVLKRPYIANVNLLILVFAHKNPDLSPRLITKFLVLAEASGIPFQVIFNKTDLVSRSRAEQLAASYRACGYPVMSTSTLTHLGRMRLQATIKDKVTVFAGPSGVGKSALVNMVAPGLKLVTGSVSSKIGRGRHTTREVQLLTVKRGSYLADTPGFSQIDLDFIEPPMLAGFFPEFRPYLNQCKFATCLHRNEPRCAITAALTAGAISPERYQAYLDLLEEIQAAWRNRYR